MLGFSPSVCGDAADTSLIRGRQGAEEVDE